MTGTALERPRPAATSALVAELPLVLAAVANLGLLALGGAVGGSTAVHWPVVQSLSAPIVAAATLAPTTIGLVVTGRVGRRRPGFVRVARWTGVVVAITSMSAALVAGDDLATRATLAPMHLVVAAAWFAATRLLPRRG